MSVLDKIFNGDFLYEREKTILWMRIEGKTLAIIGEYFGLSRERIRQIGERIKFKLYTNLTKEELEEYVRLRKAKC